MGTKKLTSVTSSRCSNQVRAGVYSLVFPTLSVECAIFKSDVVEDVTTRISMAMAMAMALGDWRTNEVQILSTRAFAWCDQQFDPGGSFARCILSKTSESPGATEHQHLPICLEPSRTIINRVLCKLLWLASESYTNREQGLGWHGRVDVHV